MADGSVRVRVRQLLEHAGKLPEPVGAGILACGTGAVGPLLELLRDETLADPMAPGKGYAPVHAVRLLARLKALEAIAPMVRRLMQTLPGEPLHDALLYALETFGPEAFPDALGALALARDEEERLGPLSVLSRCGVRDERIYAALLEQLQEEPVQGAMNLACYGDPRALEPLARALEAFPLKEDEDADAEDLFANQAIVELESAIERLGGTLDAAQRAKVERARGSRQRLCEMFQHALDRLYPPPARRRERPGRDEPCWCGSGVRYAECHLERDASG